MPPGGTGRCSNSKGSETGRGSITATVAPRRYACRRARASIGASCTGSTPATRMKSAFSISRRETAMPVSSRDIGLLTLRSREGSRKNCGPSHPCRRQSHCKKTLGFQAAAGGTPYGNGPGAVVPADLGEPVGGRPALPLPEILPWFPGVPFWGGRGDWHKRNRIGPGRR